MAETKKFLSYEGLSKFWELIQTKLVGSVDLTVDNANGATITVKDAKGTVLNTKTIGIATTTAPGLMSKEQASILNTISEDINAAVTLEGVAFNGNAATIASIGSGDNVKDKHVNLDLVYDDTKIKLVDLNNVVDGKAAVLTSIDASDFVKDGILESVTWGEGDQANTLLFTFNTASNKEVIPVDLSKFIDVYTASNGIDISGKAVSVKVKAGESYLTVDSDGLHTTTALATAINSKANAADVYTKTKTDELLATKADANNVYTKNDIDGKVEALNGDIAKKANATAVYTKDEANGLLDKKADATAVYTKDEANGLLDKKANADKVYTKTEINGTVETLEGKINSKADANNVYTKTEVDGFLDDKADATAVYTKDEANGLLDKKANAADVYTKNDIDGKVETLEGKITAAVAEFVPITDTEIAAIVNGTAAA